MNAAIEKKDFATALQLATNVLKTNYVDWAAHLVAYRAYTELKNDEQAKFHKYVCEGLIRSILRSGNGRSASAAYVVISIDEETAVLGALGIQSTRQILLSEGDAKIDRIEGTEEKTAKNVTLYFNVTTPMNWLERQKRSK
jgi:hypothetical protein